MAGSSLVWCVVIVLGLWTIGGTKGVERDDVSRSVVVQTDCGPVTSTPLESPYSSVYSSLSIPYAVPPLGTLRWQPSVSLRSDNKCWSGTLNATNSIPPCAQGGGGFEDCLYLNVYTPAPTSNMCSTYSSKLPVFVQFFGGGLIGGYPSDPKFNVAGKYPSVYVMVNYRLNAFGWLALDVLSQNSSTGKYTSGNYGLTDQNLALKWVRNNIAAFCGDINKVTIFGQSSGGTSVFGHLVSPSSTGLFSRAISMSGSPLLIANLSRAEKDNQIFINNTRCRSYINNKSQLLDCLYSLSLTEVNNAVPYNVYPFWSDNEDFDVPSPNYFSGGIMIIDGVFVNQSYTTDAFNIVPMIIANGAQENDLQPGADLANYTWNEYENFIIKRFKGFPKGSDIIKKIFQMYQISNVDLGTTTPQQAYETIASDLGVTCGNSYLAQNAYVASQKQRNGSPNIYRYFYNRGPQVPVCPNPYIDETNLCLQYAYHTWDQNMWLTPEGDTSKEDLAFGEVLRKAFYQLADKGEVDGWEAVSDERNGFGWPSVNLVNSSGVFPTKDFRGEQCTYFQDPFMMYWWEN